VLRIFLILFSLSEFISAIADLPLLQIPHFTSTASGRIAGYISDARVVLTPVVAAAALAFTLARMLSRSVAAMAVLLLIKALAAIASAIALGSGTPPLDVYSVPILAPLYVYPLLGLAALALLWRERLGPAATLALLPTGVTWLYWVSLAGVIVTGAD
jgi:hypothetical protein